MVKGGTHLQQVNNVFCNLYLYVFANIGLYTLLAKKEA